MEINDTEIFGVGVRIYKPVNRTNQANEPDKQVLLPGLIYFHGGGWTLGSLGKPFSTAFICPRQLTILYIIYVGGLKTLTALQAATVLVAMASRKKIWQLKFLQRSPVWRLLFWR